MSLLNCLLTKLGLKKECNCQEGKQNKFKVLAPIDGTIIPLENVPDPTFAQGLLGLGVGIEPKESGYIKAPISGKLIQLFETKHAFVIETPEGLNILTHFGLNTVKLKGEGFEAVAKEGDLVKAGDNIVKYDYDFLKANAESIVTPVVVLEAEDYKLVKPLLSDSCKGGETEIIEVEK